MCIEFVNPETGWRKSDLTDNLHEKKQPMIRNCG